MKDNFYEQFQKIIDGLLRHDKLLVIGDWNAKVGEQQLGEEGTVGKFGMAGQRSDKGECFVSFCMLNNLAIVSTMSPHKEIHTCGLHQMASTIIRSIMWPLDLTSNDQCKMLGRIEVQIVQVITLW